MTDIVFSTTTALARAIREKRVSATEVLDAHLAHIAKHNSTLKAVVYRIHADSDEPPRWAACPLCFTTSGACP